MAWASNGCGSSSIRVASVKSTRCTSPPDVPVKVTLISQDVIHDFFVPAFRVKTDVLPNRYVYSWFTATAPGTYHLFCSQYCGTKHSAMIGEVVVLKPEDYAAWLSSGKAEGSLSSMGEKLFQEFGCVTCHRADSGARGPNLLGLYGRPVRLSDNRVVIADDNYIRESILNPNAKIVAGFTHYADVPGRGQRRRTYRDDRVP